MVKGFHFSNRLIRAQTTPLWSGPWLGTMYILRLNWGGRRGLAKFWPKEGRCEFGIDKGEGGPKVRKFRKRHIYMPPYSGYICTFLKVASLEILNMAPCSRVAPATWWRGSCESPQAISPRRAWSSARTVSPQFERQWTGALVCEEKIPLPRNCCSSTGTALSGTSRGSKSASCTLELNHITLNGWNLNPMLLLPCYLKLITDAWPAWRNFKWK